ncbi:MAG: hypothetical protein AAF927_31880 [Bacteroidota bacterium]
MYRLFDGFKPAFFKTWDQNLLLNCPALWATKFHYALILGVLGLALSSMTVWLIPIEVSALPNAWLHLLYAGIPSALFLGIWVWQVSLFKIDKAFGEAGTKTALRDQMIYALIVIMAIGLPLLHNYQISEKSRQSISDAEMVDDINLLNVMSAFTTNYGVHYNREDNIVPLSERFKYYSFTNYAYSLAAFENAKSSDYNRTRFIYLSQPINKAKALDGLDKYLKLVDKYSTIPFEMSAEKIYEKFDRLNQEGEYISLSSAFNSAEAQAEDNLVLLQRVKLGQTHLLGDKRWKIPVFLFFWGFVLLLVGLQTSGRILLFSAILAFVLGLGAMVSANLLRYFGGINEGRYLSLFILCAMAVLGGILRFGKKTSQKGLIWRKMMLSLFVFGLVLVPISAFWFTYEVSEVFRNWESRLAAQGMWFYEYMLFLGSVLPLVFWNLGIRQAFNRLHVRPKSH